MFIRNLSLSVQDVAFQLERLIGGLYVYCRQSYKVLKPACVFPIEVELQLENTLPKYSEEQNEEEEKEEDGVGKKKGKDSDEEMLSAGYEETKGKEEKITDDLISI